MNLSRPIYKLWGIASRLEAHVCVSKKLRAGYGANQPDCKQNELGCGMSNTDRRRRKHRISSTQSTTPQAQSAIFQAHVTPMNDAYADLPALVDSALKLETKRNRPAPCHSVGPLHLKPHVSAGRSSHHEMHRSLRVSCASTRGIRVRLTTPLRRSPNPNLGISCRGA
ncbi:hypothetical protein IQ06DRAFT_131607 [Phaeosphaeriaceae sp. SRC1lsM3a]|nr:hypothetical protein IQ06DRAFT_131607 [Stagonospora sp. SRC1lsM3a]